MDVKEQDISNKNLAVGVGIAMLFLAIPSGLWSYGYYILLRWVVTGIAIYTANVAYKLGGFLNKIWLIILAGVALVFNPIIPFHLQKADWVVIDFITALFLLGMIPTIRLPKRDETQETHS